MCALLAGTAIGRAAVEADDQTVHLFTSFRGDGDGLHLAYSTDARNWTDLGRVFLEPKVGSRLMRDPHIVRGPDGLFHMVWTSGWSDHGIGYANSPDLVHWSEQRYLPLMENRPGTKTCWAPEVYYEASLGQYLIVWSSNVETPDVTPPKGGFHRAYYILTKDFKTFTEPQMLFDPGFNNIDTTMLKVNGRYHIVFKETDDQPAGIWGAVHGATADHPLGPYTLLPEPIIKNERVEGPALVNLSGKTLLYLDYYVNHRYGVRETSDWKSWTDVTLTTDVVRGQRHGSLLAITRAEMRKLEPNLDRTPPPPVLPGVNADPHIAVFGDTFFIYPTTDGTEGWLSTSFRAWSSRDLVNWKDEGVILDLPRDLIWADLRAWAPAIATKHGKYYYYYSAAQNVGVAVADSPAGPFKDPLGKPLVAKTDFPRMQAIDPMVFVDDDGSAFLYWGQGRCKAVQLNDDMISFETADVRDLTPPGYNEGPFVHKRNGRYYLTWSEFDTRDPRYSVAYATGDSPLGPFTKAPDNPILRQSGLVKGAGHHSLMQIPGRDEWVIAYHRFRIPGGNGYNRETCLSPLRHAEDGGILPVDVFEPVRLSAESNPLSWTNPILPQRADPHVTLHTDGWYYFTATVPEYDRIELRRATTLGELSTAGVKTIWRKHARGPMSHHIWAPEIHFIDGKWYIYFAAGRAESNWHIRQYVLENSSANPLEGDWIEKGEIKMNWDSFTLDATTFEHRGTRYLVWAQNAPPEHGTALFIAEMDTPWSVVGTQICITKPDLPWERIGHNVNEAPAVIHRNGRLFMTYSASATDANYCLGLLTADENADLLEAKSWAKSPEPVFKSNPATSQYGPGHNSFTTTPDGKTDIMVYHARNYERIAGEPLNNPDRATRAQVLNWNADGTPHFGVPVADTPPPPTQN